MGGEHSDDAAELQDRFRLVSGRRILEIRPITDWHKGAVVSLIRSRTGWPDAVSVCLGDDRTDEDAFAELPGGITVRVGEPQPSAAEYHFRDPVEVQQFLVWMSECLEQGERET